MVILYDGRAWNGRIIAYINNPNEVQSKEEFKEAILTADFEPLVTKGTMNEVYMALRGPYILYTESERQGILDMDGNTVFIAEEGVNIEYCDGERVILQNGWWQSEDDPARYRLTDMSGTALTEDYSYLTPGDDLESGGPAPSFAGLRGGVAELLDRDGKVLASGELPEASGVFAQGDGVFTYQVQTDERYEEGLLGAELEVLVPSGKYSSIHRISDWDSGERVVLDYLECRYEANGSSAIDILDMEGNVVIGGLSQVGSCGPDRLAVVKGFSMGLMDWEGNWIREYSVFQSFADD